MGELWMSAGKDALAILLRKLAATCSAFFLRKFAMAGAAGFEPATYGFGDRRSTN